MISSKLMEVQVVNYRIQVNSDLMCFELHKILSDNSEKINDFIKSLSEDIKEVKTERIAFQR